MSHIICPLCGLNRPLKHFDPRDYEFDLKLRENIGQGRGMDFIRNDYSVLGDDTYSPMIADRCLDLVKMFLDADVLTIQDILGKLKQYDGVNFMQQELFKVNALLIKEKRDRKSSESSLNFYLDREKRKNKEDMKKLEKKHYIELILLKIVHSNLFTVELIKNEEEEHVINIIDYDEKRQDEAIMFIKDLLDELTKSDWFLLRKRLDSSNSVINTFFSLCDKYKGRKSWMETQSPFDWSGALEG